MNASVLQLYRNGKKISDGQKAGVFVTGDLNMGICRNPVNGRISCEACLLGDGGTQLITSIYDANCVVIAGYGLRLRGVEFTGGREVAQEWWCLPSNKAGATPVDSIEGKA